MTKIRINKMIAWNQIEKQILGGRELIDRLNNGVSTDPQAKWLKIQEQQISWSAHNASLLRRFFDDDSVVAKYQSLDVATADENHSLFENEAALQTAVKQKVTWLENLRNRLDEFPQSELTPRRFLQTARKLNLEGPADWSARLEDYLYGRES